MMLKCHFSLKNIEVFLLPLLSARSSLCIWSKQQLSYVGRAPKAKQVKVEIKDKDKGFFGNKRSLSLGVNILQELKPQVAGWFQQGSGHK